MRILCDTAGVAKLQQTSNIKFDRYGQTLIGAAFSSKISLPFLFYFTNLIL